MTDPRDAADVCATLYAFAQGIDTRDWALLESVFTDPFEYDYTSHRPGAGGVLTPGEWVAARRRRFGTMTATQHSMTNPRVVVDGDAARVRMYVEAWHFADIDGRGEWCTIGGEYHDELVRDGGRWLISKLRLDRRWTCGNPAVLDLPT
jgi:SnoaL-like domain